MRQPSTSEVLRKYYARRTATNVRFGATQRRQRTSEMVLNFLS